MNREIKFRSWDGEKFITSDCQYCGSKNYNSDYVVQQFTGLLDKNGKEIYEGDIVRDTQGCDEVVSFGIQEVDAFEGMGFNLWPFMKSSVADGSALKEFEVVGNIYESPELLAPKDNIK